MAKRRTLLTWLSRGLPRAYANPAPRSHAPRVDLVWIKGERVQQLYWTVTLSLIATPPQPVTRAPFIS
jgi:hypothetical protein